MLKIYNTITKKKENITNKNIIKIYTCGITVYDNCHIGHARIFLFFDTLIRYLKTINIKTIYIRNITDVDDKIITKALNLNKSLKYITEKFTQQMHEDTKTLNIVEPSFEPKATTFVNKMIILIDKLISDKHAYKAKNNDVYYDTTTYKKYGQLSKRIIKNVQTENNQHKKHIEDFALWKNNKKNENIYWPSPWGFGRPGWHTECSTMSLYYTKKNIDIHGGGQDLIFPHHENEITQCESITKKTFVKIWMHVGHLKIDNQKMSKTKKNYILIKDILKKFNEETIRFFFLSTHYRKPITFSIKNITQIKNNLNNLYKTILPLTKEKKNIVQHFKTRFIHALNDDLNTPKAISILFEIIKKVKFEKNTSLDNVQDLIYTIKHLGNIIGIFKINPHLFLNKNNLNTKSKKIELLIEKRNKARKQKNWKLSDEIRIKLNQMNIKIEDKKYTTIYSKLL